MAKKKQPAFTADDPNDVILTPAILAAVRADVADIDKNFFGDLPSCSIEERRAAIRANMRRIIAKTSS